MAERKGQYEQEIASNSQLVKEEQAQLSRQNQQLMVYRETRQQTQERIRALEDGVRQKRQQQERLREQKYQLELHLNKVQGYLSGGYRRLAQNFDCTYEEAQQKAIVLENVSQAQKIIQQLKGQLSRLGEINFTAIEEFEQVRDRLQFCRPK